MRISVTIILLLAAIASAAIETKINPKDQQSYSWIAPGSFKMGCSQFDLYCAADEKPVHSVEVTRGFWMAQTPVTVAAWTRYRMATGKPALPSEDQYGRKINEASSDIDQPAVEVTWDEAKAYCGWAGMRLPTEAEWEFAARAGTTSATYDDVGKIAWYADNSGRKKLESRLLFESSPSKYEKRLLDNLNGPRGVRQMAPNAWGLYDILGNVWEWVADYYAPDYYSHSESKDPQGPATGAQRVLRGGAWNSVPNDVRVSYRRTNPPADRVNTFGFRCVGDLP